MARIEIAGPPGVGKSTLKNQLIRYDKYSFLSQDTLSILNLFALKKSKIKYVLQFYSHFKVGTLLTILGDYYLRRYIYKNRKKINESWDNFLSEFISEFLGAEEGKKESINRILAFIQNVHAIIYYEFEQIHEKVIFDEGIVQRGYSLAFTGVFRPHIVRKYFRSMPAADLYIIMDDSDNALRDKIQKRDVSSHFIEFIQKAKDVNRILLEVLEERNLPYKYIHYQEGLPNVQEIARLINMSSSPFDKKQE